MLKIKISGRNKTRWWGLLTIVILAMIATETLADQNVLRWKFKKADKHVYTYVRSVTINADKPQLPGKHHEKVNPSKEKESKSEMTGQVTISGGDKGMGELAIAFYMKQKDPKDPKKLTNPVKFGIDELGTVKALNPKQTPRRDMKLLFMALSLPKDDIKPKTTWKSHVSIQGNGPHPNEGDIIFMLETDPTQKDIKTVTVKSSFVLGSNIQGKTAFGGNTNWSGSTEGVFDLTQGIYTSVVLKYSSTSEYSFSHKGQVKTVQSTERGEVSIKLNK